MFAKITVVKDTAHLIFFGREKESSPQLLLFFYIELKNKNKENKQKKLKENNHFKSRKAKDIKSNQINQNQKMTSSEIKISNYNDERNGKLTFTIEGIDVSVVNALRRTIMMDIDTVVFKTMPYEQNKATISVNTSRLNNEILKQRLSCIPIHNPSFFAEGRLNQLVLELDVENKTNTTLTVTTKDFQIRQKGSDPPAYLPPDMLKTIFPPFVAPTSEEFYIEFVRLRPKIGSSVPGERIKLECEFSIDCARTDSMFNVVNTCSYGFTPDKEKIKQASAELRVKLQQEGKKPDEIEFEIKNWHLLEALRITVPNSFDFVLESNGIFTNEELVYLACNVIIRRIQALLNGGSLRATPSPTTVKDSFDVRLENEDYTIGNVLNYILYECFFDNQDKLQNKYSFCGFKKFHPHDTHSVIRLAYLEPALANDAVEDVRSALRVAEDKFQKIQSMFIPKLRG